MDYKELLRRGHNWRGNNFRQETNEPRNIIAEMSTAIETLLMELEAAVEMLRGECHACKHNTGWHNVGKCTCCTHETAGALLPKDQCADNWEWKGLQSEAD